jgi:hypothetical protein
VYADSSSSFGVTFISFSTAVDTTVNIRSTGPTSLQNP